MLFIRSINPSYRAPIPLPPTPHAGAQPLAGLMTWRAQKKKKKKKKRVSPGLWRWRIADVPSPRLVINIEFLPANETRNLWWVSVRGAQAHSLALNIPLLSTQRVGFLSTYLPTYSTYLLSLSPSLSTEPCNQPFSEPITVQRSPVHGRSNTQRLGPDRTRRVARIPVEKCAQRTNADEMIATGWYRVAFLLLFVRERRRRR